MRRCDRGESSGVYSLDGYDWTLGFTIQVDAYVDVNADWHGIEFGIARLDRASGDGLPHDIGLNWKQNPEYENVVVRRTDLETVEVPAGDHLGSWTTITITTSTDTPVRDASWGAIKAMSR